MFTKKFWNSNFWQCRIVRKKILKTKISFLNKVLEIGESGYTPSIDDILRLRVKTCGVNESDFTVDKVYNFKMIDGIFLIIINLFYIVGGQRNERKKW